MTTTGINTTASTAWRTKFYSANLQEILKVSQVSQAICEVDRTDAKYIYNPYGADPTVTISVLSGTYAVDDFTTTNDTLEVDQEFKVAEHIYDFEDVLNNYNLFANRASRQAYKVADAIDKWVLNQLCEDGTATYSTPAGGFTTAANWNTIVANIISTVSGYSDVRKGLFLVVENTDLTGIVVSQMTNGYSFADAALNNGLVTHQGGVDIYVVRTGTFTSTTSGTKTWTNSGHRVAGVKGVATYAAPRGVKHEEKSVSGKTGKELVTYGYCGFKLWTQMAALIIDITIT